MPPPTRLLVLGVDAANPELVERWAADGSLPRLGALMGRGLFGRTRSVAGFFVGSTWPSFYTGVTPARHGLHYLRQLRPGTYNFHRPAQGELVRSDPIWRHLSRAGRRVAVLDVPLTQIEPDLNGIQMVEWGGHDQVFGFRAFPRDLGGTIASRYGHYPLAGPCDAIGRSAAGYRRFADSLVDATALKARLTADLLRRGGWDFFIQVFTESHCAGHQCWHLHDPAHPAHDPDAAGRAGDPLRRVYRAIDAAIGDLVDAAAGAVVLVVSAHGMSYWFGAQFLLPEILFELGLAARPRGGPAPAGESGSARAAARWVWRRLPPGIRRGLTPLRNRITGRRAEGEQPAIGVDPGASRCFPHPNGLAVGGIRLNLLGREPQGLVAPGLAAEQLWGEITRELTALVDERTGRPAVRRVMRTADLYAGPHLDELPDLLVEWSDEIPVGSALLAGGAGATVRLRSPRLGRLVGVNRYGRSGEHRPEGFFIAAGPGVPAGRPSRVVSILDFAPTIGELLGVPLPPGDGRPIAELLG